MVEQEQDDPQDMIVFNQRETPQLFQRPWVDSKEGCLQAHLMKSQQMRSDDGTASSQSTGDGYGGVGHVLPHPFNMRAVSLLMRDNEHHSTCIHTKVYSAVGEGHDSDEVERVLNPISGRGWLHELTCAVYDYFQCGNLYLEVVRDEQGAIKGIYHVPAHTVQIVLEDDETKHQHFLVGDPENGSSELRVFACFGDADDLRKRLKGSGTTSGTYAAVQGVRSELIHVPMPNSLTRYYGFPDWLSAAAAIDLVQMMTQESFDFFYNRGVPEFMLFLLGKQLSKENWAKVQAAMRSTIGPGNAHKSLALNITDPQMQVQVEKLALDGKSGGSQFKEMGEILGLNIVTAHRIPPVLGNIVIPGKMAAANELMNALMVTQVLVVGPAQRRIETALGLTLGNPKLNGDLGLSPDSFKFTKITDVIAEGLEALQPADTMSRMRQEMPAAAAEGRDLKDGLKKMQKKLDGLPGFDGDIQEILRHPIAAARVGGAVLAGLTSFIEEHVAAAA